MYNKTTHYNSIFNFKHNPDSNNETFVERYIPDSIVNIKYINYSSKFVNKSSKNPTLYEKNEFLKDYDETYNRYTSLHIDYKKQNFYLYDIYDNELDLTFKKFFYYFYRNLLTLNTPILIKNYLILLFLFFQKKILVRSSFNMEKYDKLINDFYFEYFENVNFMSNLIDILLLLEKNLKFINNESYLAIVIFTQLDRQIFEKISTENYYYYRNTEIPPYLKEINNKIVDIYANDKYFYNNYVSKECTTNKIINYYGIDICGKGEDIIIYEYTFNVIKNIRERFFIPLIGQIENNFKSLQIKNKPFYSKEYDKKLIAYTNGIAKENFTSLKQLISTSRKKITNHEQNNEQDILFRMLIIFNTFAEYIDQIFYDKYGKGGKHKKITQKIKHNKTKIKHNKTKTKTKRNKRKNIKTKKQYNKTK